MEPKGRNRRRNYLVDSRFQLGFIIHFVAWLAVLTVVSAGASYAVLARVLERNLYSPHIFIGRTGEALGPPLVWLNCALAAALTALLILAVHRQMRRLSGSLSRFAAHVRGMSGGVVPGPVHFRRDDLFEPTAAAFNHMAEALRQRFDLAAADLDEAKRRLSEGAGGIAPAAEALGKARRRLEFP